MIKDRVKINASDLVRLTGDGMTREEIAKHYGLPIGQIKDAFAEAGLSKLRSSHRKFILINDLPTQREEPASEPDPF